MVQVYMHVVLGLQAFQLYPKAYLNPQDITIVMTYYTTVKRILIIIFILNLLVAMAKGGW